MAIIHRSVSATRIQGRPVVLVGSVAVTSPGAIIHQGFRYGKAGRSCDRLTVDTRMACGGLGAVPQLVNHLELISLGNTKIVIETGIDNLADDESRAVVHFGKDSF